MKKQAAHEARQKILEAVESYYETFHNPRAYSQGDRISYAGRVYDAEELRNLVDSALDFWLTAGRYADEFEKLFAQFLGVKYCYAVNSGSSANLLAFMALTSPSLGDRRIFRGDEVITLAAGFPTTVAPIIQYGAIPVFVDISIPQYNIDVSQLESALSAKTKAVMIAHTLGNPFDIGMVKSFCDRHGLWLIEDNCDALGSQYYYKDALHHTGTVGDIGTSSFYPPHHMTTGEGGAVYTNNPVLSKLLLSFRDWGRDCICPSGRDNLCGHRFDRQYGELPIGYDHKYVYSHFGYNLKLTEMQAAIGCAQIKKLPSFVTRRRENFEYIKNRLNSLENILILPEALPRSNPSWFGFMVTCQPGKRDSAVNHLERNNIQTRMLFAGNLIKHPCFNEMRQTDQGFRAIGDLPNTNTVMRDSFWIGVYPGMNERMLDTMIKVIREAF